MDKYYEFYCNYSMRDFEQAFKKQRNFYIPVRIKDKEEILKNDRFFKKIINEASRYLKMNKKFLNYH